MNKVWIVARWEFLKNLKLKQEIVSYLIMGVIYAALLGVQMWQTESRKTTINLGIVGQINTQIPQNIELREVPELADSHAYTDYLRERALDGILLTAPDWQLILPNTVSWSAGLIAALEADAREKLLLELNLEQQQLNQLQNPLDMKIINLAQQNVGDDAELLSVVVAILAALAVFNCFGLCMTSVTQEKQQRITEQLLTCVNFQQWIDGKALGLCLSSLKSLFATALFMLIIFSAVTVLGQGVSIDLALAQAPVVSMVLFCILGIILWNYLFVGFSATIDDPNHSGKTGIMLLPMLPVMLVFMLLDDPAGEVATVLSIFPLTSISFMPMRLSSMEVPLWQFGVSLVLMLFAIWFVRLYATRIFRANITLLGKEPSWYQIWNNMRNKSQ